METTRETRGVGKGGRAGRFGVLALMVVLFAGAASVFGPFASSARPRGEDGGLVRGDGGVLVGRTLGREHRLIVYVMPGGPRYTVTTASGQVLARDLEASEVYRQFPDLDPGELHLGPDDSDGRWMMVEPDQ